MQEEPATTTGTVQQEQHGSGFPPFKTDTYSSQVFWLLITFGFLFVVLWRVAGPRIQNILGERRGKIAQDLQAAEQNRQRAENAAAAYQAPLIEARERARVIAEETRTQMTREGDKAKAEADATANAETAKAQTRIAELQAEARRNIADVAQGAVVDIVQRLTGQTVSTDEASAAVREAVG